MAQSIKIISSVVLFGAYECPVFKKHELSPSCIVLSIKRGDENMNMQLSFKHITKVEFLDNMEQSGAGLVLHVNDFMADKIQMYLDDNGTGFSKHQSPYAKNRFIVIDILNSDPNTIMQIRAILQHCTDFHRTYVIEQCNKNGSDAASSLPASYICVIYFNQWRTLLGTMGKDSFLETIQAKFDGNAIKYVAGTICPIKPREVFTMNKDGVVSRRKIVNENRPESMENSQTTGPLRNPNIRSPLRVYPHISAIPSVSSSQEIQLRPMSQGSENFGAQLQLSSVNSTPSLSLSAVTLSSPTRQISKPNGQSPSARLSTGSTLATRTPTKSGSRQSKREVHVIEMDDDEDSPEKLSPKKRSNDTVFVYPSSGKNACSVQFSDLRYLDSHYMLNDTIIDFYLKYILYDMVPPERRSRIFMFSSFFYSRLSQIPPHASNFNAVRAWTKNVNLFEKEQIIIPINEDIHWYLAVIVNVNAGIIHERNNGQSTTQKTPAAKNGKVGPRQNIPYIIIFDSLIDPAEPKHSPVKRTLAEYLCLEYNDKKDRYKLPGSGYDKSSVGIVNPRGMPQQINFLDCGLFLLHFAELFMTNPPKIKNKRYDIRKCIKRLGPHVKYSDFLADPQKEAKENSKNKTMQFLPYELPTRSRSYSESDANDLKKEEKFTSSLRQSRSLDSILSETKDALSMTVTIRDLKRWKLDDD
ncbi:ubiquitin-like-specific protease 2 [Ditylenchus destructor]|nr:ubiquitin-like-specific protease 2 [Ditylenchus destructor]